MLGAAREGAESLLVFAEGPDWAAKMTAWGTLATALILGVTGFVVWRQLRDAKKTRHGGLLADLSRRWDEPLMVESQRLFARYSTSGIVDLVEKL